MDVGDVLYLGRRTLRLYEQNKHLDRDRDRVACEKR
jgi:hypothetical protein